MRFHKRETDREREREREKEKESRDTPTAYLTQLAHIVLEEGRRRKVGIC